MAKSSLDVDEEDDYMHQAIPVARSSRDVGEGPVRCVLPTPPSSVTFSDDTNRVNATNDQLPQEEEQASPWYFRCSGRKVVLSIMLMIIAVIICDAMFASPEDRLLKPDFAETFLIWVQAHPSEGAVGMVVLIAFALVFLIPIGTPLALGCGYIYKSAYGWELGLTIATSVSMVGSALGGGICFLLGRYLMRDQVRTWIRNYPLFVAIDIAATEQGMSIMAMLHLTPILPLGPISYMSGTTSMALSSFLTAKIASLPLKLLYAVIGASAVGSAGALVDKASEDGAAGDGLKNLQENRSLIIAGIFLSFVMIAFITHYTKKELNKILDRQKIHKPGVVVQSDDDIELTSLFEANEDVATEIGSPIGSPQTAPRQRLNSAGYKGFESIPHPPSLYRGT